MGAPHRLGRGSGSFSPQPSALGAHNDKGKIANLLVTDGELFQDRTKVKYVFVDGMKYEPAAIPVTAMERMQ